MSHDAQDAMLRQGMERPEILEDGHRGPRPGGHGLRSRQKAAIIVRVLLAEGATLPLSALPDHIQAALTEQMGAMRMVDRATLDSVIDEFVEELERAGMAFPGGIDGALTMLDGHISASAANRLRRMAGVSSKSDPWERIARLEAERLLPALERECVEVGAVILSKLGTARAAELLEQLPGERARRIAHAMARTGRIDPETVRRIGLALVVQLEAQPLRAFEEGPDTRMGAILTSAPAATRDALLADLESGDPDFAESVRRAIFTFANIAERIPERDIPGIIRRVDQRALTRALVAASAGSAAEQAAGDFILAHLPQRMAEALRGDIAEHPPLGESEGEAAMGEVVETIRRMEAQGEITLVVPEEV